MQRLRKAKVGPGTIILYTLAAATLGTAVYAASFLIYYLFLTAVAETYNGHVRNAEFLAFALSKAKWFIPPTSMAVLAYFIIQKLETTPKPAPPTPVPEQRHTTASANQAKSDNLPMKPPRIRIAGLNIRYPLWGRRFSRFHTATGCAGLALIAFSMGDIFQPDFFSEDKLQYLNYTWSRAILSWADSWWAPYHAWIFLSLSILSVTKGTADHFIRMARLTQPSEQTATGEPR